MPLLRSTVLFAFFLQTSANPNAQDGGFAANAEGLPGVSLAKLTTAFECRQNLVSGQVRTVTNDSELNSSRISILNWNLKKGEEFGWELDLAQLSSNKQLVLLQEAAMSMRLPLQLRETPFAVFSPGYVKDDDVTGVSTFSTVAPLSQCRLAAREPWLGTPKSTNVSQYALSDTNQSLVVVNIHALNFSLGLVAYREQLAAVANVLRDHKGPVILSGDFNTWRPARRAVVDEYIARLGLRAVKFEVDYRTRIFDLPLDHIFVRGLTVIEAETFRVESSDHNPMTATFSLP